MNNKKTIYENAQIEILALGKEDIICSSNGGGSDTNGSNGSIDLPDIEF